MKARRRPSSGCFARPPDPRGDAAAPTAFSTSLDRAAYMAGVESIRGYIAHGDIYQANLTRRLEAPFDGDPWPLYRRLRTGDPSLYAAYVDLGGRRAILFGLAGAVPVRRRRAATHHDPIKGTRPRGRTREEDRALACELMASEKDRAENVMISTSCGTTSAACARGTVRVPRLCRLERTAAVQHLVSKVTGRLAPGRDSFDLRRRGSRAARSPARRRSVRWSCSRSWSPSDAGRTPVRSAGSARTGRWRPRS